MYISVLKRSKVIDRAMAEKENPWTAGPWKWKDGSLLTEKGDRVMDSVMNPVNDRLIAAAPQLADLIEKLESYVRSDREGGGEFDKRPDGLLCLRARRLLEFIRTGNACPHPRAQWYGDREYGGTFCGMCGKKIDPNDYGR